MQQLLSPENTLECMNPIRWLLNLSSDLAERRGGRSDPVARASVRVDSREYEAWIEIGGASLLETNLKWPERWVQVSENAKRMARVVEGQDGLLRLTVYEREARRWRQWEGPAILESLEAAIQAGEVQLER